MPHLKSIEDILCRSKYWGSLKFEGLDASFFNDIWRCTAILSKDKQTYYNQEAQSRVQSWEGCYAQIRESGGALKKFQIPRPPSFLLKTKYVLHKAQNKTKERKEVNENTRREIALAFSFVRSWFPRPSNNYFLLLNWLRSRLLTTHNEREPGEKETGALGKHSRRTTNHAYDLPKPSQIPRNERQRLALFVMFAYLNWYRAIWG